MPGLQKDTVKRDGEMMLTVPPPGLGGPRGLRIGLLLASAVIVLLGVFALPALGPSLSGRFVGVLCAFALLGAAAYVALRSMLDKVDVRVSHDAIEVTHTFPLKSVKTMGRKQVSGVVIGRPHLVSRGYYSPEWGSSGAEIVVWGDGRLLHFGEGLPHEEQQWLKDCIESTLQIGEALSAEVVDDGHASTIQPPERLWVDIARYAAYCVVAGGILLAILVLLGADSPSIGSAVILVVFSGTVAVLGYRNYRLERVASGWHRAVVKFLANKRGQRFSPVDSMGIGRKLPDFAFFGGARLLYNVAWSDSDEHDLIAFDVSARGIGLVRDGVGCALRVTDLSHEAVSLKPLAFPGALWRWGALRMDDHPDLMQRFRVQAENEGRALQLLGEEVLDAILAWKGQGPPPWISVKGGMVGLYMPRKYATNDRAMRAFYDYGEKIRRAIERRLHELRGSGSGGGEAARQD